MRRAAFLLLLLASSVAAQPDGNATAGATDGSGPPPVGDAPRGLISRVVDAVDPLLPEILQSELSHFVLTLLAWAALSAIGVLVLAPAMRWATKRTKTDLDDVIVGILGRPLFMLIFVYGVVDSLLALNMAASVDDVIFRIWRVVVVIQLTVIIYKLWKEVLLSLGRRLASKTETELDDKLYPFFSKVGGLVIILIGIWQVVASFGVNMTFFAAGGAIGGLVIAFAAQDTLANFFAGIHILLDHPFREGDRIEIKEENTWGDVVDIGLRTTRIRTRDNRLVIIPNSVIGSSAVINHSMPNPLYRTETHVGIAYGTDVELARKALVEAVLPVEGIRNDHPVEALFVEFGDSSMVFRVRWWLHSFEDTRRVFDRVHTAIEKRLREDGIEIPFPQRVLWNGAKPGRPAVGLVPAVE